MKNTKIKVAIIDLYNNEPNQGMRCLQDILNETDCKYTDVTVEYRIHESRYLNDVPCDDYDIYLSSGGPGSPFDGDGSKWENDYFLLLDKLVQNNQSHGSRKKYMFFICHSFQLMARYFKFGTVNERHTKSFGIVPVELTGQGAEDPVFSGFKNPFFAADFRSWQVIDPNETVIRELGGSVPAMEYMQEGMTHQPALMGFRIGEEFLGTQFHPEADPASMYYHLRKPERIKQVVEEHGEKKYREMVAHLEQPDNIWFTRHHVLPRFLTNAIQNLTTEK